MVRLERAWELHAPSTYIVLCTSSFRAFFCILYLFFYTKLVSVSVSLSSVCRSSKLIEHKESVVGTSAL